MSVCIDRNYEVGQVIELEGRRWRITRKGSTAYAMSRYYWFDAAWDWLVERCSREFKRYEDAHTDAKFHPEG